MLTQVNRTRTKREAQLHRVRIPLGLVNLHPGYSDAFMQGMSAIELLLRFLQSCLSKVDVCFADGDHLRSGRTTYRMETKVHCGTYQSVGIEKGLHRESPENGNITEIGWRLSGISRRSCRNSRFGDATKVAGKPPFCGIFTIFLRTILG